MKKFLFSCIPLLLAATASANTISLQCPVLALLGQNGNGVENCAGFTGANAPPGGALLNFITIVSTFDFQFNPLDSSTASVDYTFDYPNSVADVNGTATQASRPQNTTKTVTCTGVACAPYLAAFTVNDSYTGTSAVTGATFSKKLTLDYSTNAIPEPATFGLVGMALIAVRFIRKK